MITGLSLFLDLRRSDCGNAAVNRRNFLAVTSAAAASLALRSERASGQTQPTSVPATKPTTIPADLVWHDVRDWGVEGKGFSDTQSYFDRLPARAKGVVRDPVWDLSRNSAGLSVRFETDATNIYIRYFLRSGSMLAMAHMPATGVSGIDLYARDGDAWRWCATHFPKEQNIEAKLVSGLLPGHRPYLMNLPLYNGVRTMDIGVAPDAKFVGTPPRTTPPIVFYGTSITQGGCASRPGMAFPSIVGRRLDRPIINLGFSGNGHAEPEVGALLAELNPALFVIDCLANCSPDWVHDRIVALVKQLRAARAETPILMMEDRYWASGELLPGESNFQKLRRVEYARAFDTLIDTGIARLHYRKGDDLIGSDGEGTVDGSHPNDLGMMRYADAIEPALRRLLP